MIHAIRKSIFGLGAAAMMLVASFSHAQSGMLFGGSSVGVGGSASNSLIAIDPTTGAGATVGLLNNSTSDITGLAFDPLTRTLFGTQGASLLSIDLATGTATTIASTVAGDIIDIAFNTSTNTLFAAVNEGSDDALITIDTTTGSTSRLGLTDLNIGAISFGPGGSLFAIETGGADELATIDLVTLTDTRIGQLGVSIGSFPEAGLAFDPSTNTFFSHNTAFGVPEQLLAISPTTGAATAVGPIGFPIDALVFVPNAIPEPASSLLICLSSVSCLFYRRRISSPAPPGKQ